jgi:FAD/FMN-containing dehydrogenase
MERAFFGEAVDVLAPVDESELADVVRDAERGGAAVVPAGLGAHAVVCDPPADGAVHVSTRAFDGVAEYRPDDFTIGVGAGMPLTELRATLAEHGQEIPIDGPAEGGGTVGGLVARGAAGPRQGRYGPLSAFVLGIDGLRGEGRAFRSGGMVVKNVAGYQLAKLLVGALGAAGFLLRVNFRVRPLPARRRLGWARFADDADAWAWAAELRASGLEPAALAVRTGAETAESERGGIPAAGRGALAAWVFEGGAATVAWQCAETAKRLAARTAPPEASDEEDGDAAARFLDHLAAFSETGGAVPPDLGIVRIAVLPSALAGTAAAVRESFREREGFAVAMAGDAATGLLTVRWQGPPDAVDAPVKSLRQIVRSRDGAARLFYLPPGPRARFGHVLGGNPNAVLAAAVLSAFDPHGVFSRRRGGTTAAVGDAS